MESKARRIFINEWGDRDLSLMLTINHTFVREIGLKVIDHYDGLHDVIDEQLFMIAVMKYGIKWKPLICYDKL